MVSFYAVFYNKEASFVYQGKRGFLVESTDGIRYNHNDESNRFA